MLPHDGGPGVLATLPILGWHDTPMSDAPAGPCGPWWQRKGDAMSDATSEYKSAFSALAKIHSEAQPNTRRYWHALTLTAGLVVLTAGGIWCWEGSQPITPDQRVALTAVVAQEARQTGKSRQAVWERLKRHYNVRRVDDLIRHQARQAMTDLAR